MAHIRKRILPSGKTRFQVVWEAGGKRVSEMFETFRDANAMRIAIEGSKPNSAAGFKALAADYAAYMESLVEAGQRERSYLSMIKGHINGHILPDKELSGLRCCSIGTPEVQLFCNRLIAKVSVKQAIKIRTHVVADIQVREPGRLCRGPTRCATRRSSARPGRRWPGAIPSRCPERMCCAA